MRNFVCDRCGKELEFDDKHNTSIKFGYKAVGWYDFEDLCVGCGMWLYTFLNGEKRLRLKDKEK